MKKNRIYEMLFYLVISVRIVLLFTIVVVDLTNTQKGCGKTSLIRRWDCDKFDPDGKASVGMNYVSKTIKISKNTNITLRVWDTAGQERFGTIVNTLFKNADGVLLCFDLSDPESLRNISSWRKAVLRKSSRRLATLFLVGLKKDIQHLEGSVTDDDLAKTKDQYDEYDLVLTSAKTGENVNEAFDMMARKLLEIEFLKSESEKINRGGIPIDRKEKNHGRSCCG